MTRTRDLPVFPVSPDPVRPGVSPDVSPVHLEVEAVVAAPLASGYACLSEEERELGVALVEIGADVTNVVINCGAVPKELLEAELFGALRGAFPGAVRDRPGLFCVADGGTPVPGST